jgi:hypothetical protein
MNMLNPTTDSVFIRGLIGLSWGCGIAGLAFLMLGYGEGWVNAIFSSAAIFLAPVAAVAWEYRGRTRGTVLAALAIFPGLLIDLYLVTHTENLGRIWSLMPLIVVAWAVLWLGWQVIAVWAGVS